MTGQIAATKGFSWRNTGRLLAVLLAGCLCSTMALAGELAPVEVATRLQQAYDSSRTMEADFRQVAEVAMSSRKRSGEGKLAILKPGRIRWDYTAPDTQVLLSDGKQFFMYFAKSSQMIVQSIDEYLNSDVTYSFFTGTGNILRDFEVLAAEQPAGEGTLAIKLVPRKPHPQVDYLHIWVRKDNFTINRLEIVDQFGSVTTIDFSNVRLNQEIPEGRFTFTPPPGTEIVSQ